MNTGPRMSEQRNTFAYLRSVHVETNMVSVETFGKAQLDYLPGLGEVRFEGVAALTPGVLQAMDRWMQQPAELPYQVREWMCLYCASPNALFKRGDPVTHCTQCGAPRNWLLG